MKFTYKFIYSALIVLLSTPLLCSADTKDCFRIADDGDRDGYAVNGATAVSTHVRQREKLSYPNTHVLINGDIDDNNSLVHPRRPEIADNGVDDNSNGSRDEPEFIYPQDNQRGVAQIITSASR